MDIVWVGDAAQPKRILEEKKLPQKYNKKKKEAGRRGEGTDLCPHKARITFAADRIHSASIFRTGLAGLDGV